MKAYNGYKAEPTAAAREIIPAGGYAAKILSALEAKYEWGSVLLIYFDISEGQYKDFFKTDYANNTNEDKKWRGVLRLSVPKDDGSEKDDWTKRSFNNAMWAVESSNPGYSWTWDEKTLEKKNVGVLFRNKEWEMNGKTGWTTECSAFTSIDNIHNGKFKLPKDKQLANKSSATNFTELEDSDPDLPF